VIRYIIKLLFDRVAPPRERLKIETQNRTGRLFSGFSLREAGGTAFGIGGAHRRHQRRGREGTDSGDSRHDQCFLRSPIRGGSSNTAGNPSRIF